MVAIIAIMSLLHDPESKMWGNEIGFPYGIAEKEEVKETPQQIG
jgi:hypothetical protein